jgi:hypothetical protein
MPNIVEIMKYIDKIRIILYFMFSDGGEMVLRCASIALRESLNTRVIRITNSLFREVIPCFGDRNSLFFGREGNHVQYIGISARIGVTKHQNGEKFMKFPVIFPVLRESAAQPTPVRSSSPRPD